MCNNGWYHGYQGLGLVFTHLAASYNYDNYAVGGGIADCQAVSQANLLSCGVVEYFQYPSVVPNWTTVKPSFTTAAGADWGLVGISGLSLNADSNLLLASYKIGVGTAQSTNAA